MTGVEYHVLHVQEPILYVIRKANRQSHNSCTFVAKFSNLDACTWLPCSDPIGPLLRPGGRGLPVPRSVVDHQLKTGELAKQRLLSNINAYSAALCRKPSQ